MCDVSKRCDGSSKDCSANTFASATTTCGSAPVGTCDLQDTCSGEGAYVENIAAVGTICQAATSECNVSESCDGFRKDCATNAFAPATISCGSAPLGACNLQNTCSGEGACVKNIATAGTVCPAAAGECDVSESCNGSSKTVLPIHLLLQLPLVVVLLWVLAICRIHAVEQVPAWKTLLQLEPYAEQQLAGMMFLRPVMGLIKIVLLMHLLLQQPLVVVLLWEHAICRTHAVEKGPVWKTLMQWEPYAKQQLVSVMSLRAVMAPSKSVLLMHLSPQQLCVGLPHC